MILGLLLIVGLLVYVSITQIAKEDLDARVANVQEVPAEYQPLQDYVTSCLEEITQDALRLVGEHGGYTDPTKFGMSINSFHPTEGDAVEIFPGSGMIVPYWHYMDSPNICNDCTFNSKMPTLHQSSDSEFDASIERQIELYIEDNIDRCIANFTDLKGISQVTPQRVPEATVVVREQDVLVYLDYPIDVLTGADLFTLTTYRYIEPLRLAKIYSLAANITLNQMNHSFLERSSLNLIDLAAKPGVNSSNMPPIASTETECGNKVYWIRSSVKDRLFKPLISTYIPFLSVAGTDNMYRMDQGDETQDAIYANMIMPIEGTYDGLEARFDFIPFNDIYFEISPSRGEILEPTSINMNIIGFCMQAYRFFYDFSFPVIVEVREPSYDDGAGYSFRFALETNVRANRQINGTIKNATPTPQGYGNLMTCDPEQWLSGDVEISVKDQFDVPIPEVNILFCLPDENGQCIRDVCSIGETGADGVFRGSTPIGAGMLMLNHAGHHPSFQAFGVWYNQNATVETRMYKIEEKQVTFMKTMLRKDFMKKKWNFAPDDMRPLTLAERAIISLERVDQAEEPYITYASIEGPGFVAMDIIPGTYVVSAQLISYQPVYIPEAEKCGGTWPFKKCETIDPITLTELIVGGSYFNQDNGYLTITQEMLDEGGTIVFPLIAIDPAEISEHEDLNVIERFESHSLTSKDDIMPYMDI
ncbi:MAG: hypothetical protein ABIC95_02710 [archaeon]